ncbi:MAG: tetratricopeptide repeat protein, partial [Bacteroidota bacterium]
MKKVVSIIFLVGCFSYAQEAEDKEKLKALRASKNITWEANKELSNDDFVNAEANYRRAISKSGENVAAPYNLGNAYYNEETYSEAFSRFKQAGELASNKADKHKAYHNMGNVFMKNKEYQKAVEAYKEALRNDPTDEETRYNLALAKELLKKQQDEQKNDDNKGDQNQEDNKDKKDKNQDKKDEGDNEDENKGEENKDKNQDKGDEGDKGNEKKEENKE